MAEREEHKPAIDIKQIKQIKECMDVKNGISSFFLGALERELSKFPDMVITIKTKNYKITHFTPMPNCNLNNPEHLKKLLLGNEIVEQNLTEKEKKK